MSEYVGTWVENTTGWPKPEATAPTEPQLTGRDETTAPQLAAAPTGTPAEDRRLRWAAVAESGQYVAAWQQADALVALADEEVAAAVAVQAKETEAALTAMRNDRNAWRKTADENPASRAGWTRAAWAASSPSSPARSALLAGSSSWTTTRSTLG